MNASQTIVRPWIVAALVSFACCLVSAAANDPPAWQPMLAKSFKGQAKDLGITGLAVYRNPGCVFVLVDGKQVYCSPAGAASFKPVSETWQEVCASAQKKNGDTMHRFVLTERGIEESTDGGATWREPISVPKNFVINRETWVQYDATNGALYLMQKGSDLYRLARRK
jgi:hypothetical protein